MNVGYLLNRKVKQRHLDNQKDSRRAKWGLIGRGKGNVTCMVARI